MMNGKKEALMIATLAASPDTRRTAVAATDLEPPRFFNSFSLIANQSLLPLDNISSEDSKFIRSEVVRLLDVENIKPARSP